MQKVLEFPKLGLELKFRNSINITENFSIAFYGIIIAIGLALGLLYLAKRLKTVGVDNDKAIDAVMGGIVGAIIGARLYFVLFSWETYKNDLGGIFRIRDGGLAIYGGIIGGIVVGLIIAKWRKIKPLPLLDVVGIAFLIGQGIGRWGNFFNIEAFGSNTNLPWGMRSAETITYLTSQQEYLASIGVTVDPTMPVHPCFLYESLWCLIGFFALNLYLKHRKFDGEVFLMYLGFYGLGRFFIEGLRTDSLMIGSLRVSQLLAALLVAVSVFFILFIRSKIKNSHDPEYLKLYVKTPEGIAIANAVKKDSKKEVITEETDGELEELEEEMAQEVLEEIEEDISEDNKLKNNNSEEDNSDEKTTENNQ